MVRAWPVKRMGHITHPPPSYEYITRQYLGMCFNFLTGGGTQDVVKEWQRNDLIFGLLLLPLVLASRFYFSIFTYFGTFEASGRQHFLSTRRP